MDEQIKTLQEVLRINSEGAEAVTAPDGQVYPFGEGVQEAFEYTLKKAEELGFEATNIDNYGGHIDFGEGDETIGIIGHLDVVPAGDGWSFDPYSGAVEDGYIYGRGTTDDKGPIVAVLYAMKALKECGFVPSRKIRVILGLDEETNWNGLKYYLEKVELPDFGFTPDGEFPVVNGEKGITNWDFKFKFNKAGDTQIVDFAGGSAPNMVPEKAHVVLKCKDADAAEALCAKANEFVGKSAGKFEAEVEGDKVTVRAEGKAAHGANPHLGINAISMIMEFLGAIELDDSETAASVKFYNDHLGFDVNGERMNIAFEDEMSGKLSLNVGVASVEDDFIKLVLNVRFPVSNSIEEVEAGIAKAIEGSSVVAEKLGVQEPIFMDVDTPMVEAMMKAYVDNTGDKESKPMVIGGGTYARSFKNMLAFGAYFAEDPDLMHQRDEKLALERFDTMTRIYADAIYTLASPEFKLKW